jgi:addiction module RelE/StbE family toxin
VQIKYSRKFVTEYKKLPQSIKALAEEKEKVFKKNPFDPKLKTHKLTGRLKGRWAFSVNYKYRIIIFFESESIFWFLSVGTHNIYKK